MNRMVVVVGGLAVLAGVAWGLVRAFEDARATKAPLTEQPIEEAGRGRRGRPAYVPAVVPADVVMGWTPILLERDGARTVLTLDGASTLDRDEVVARLRNEGCPDPQISSSPSWEVRCRRVGPLRDVRVKEGDQPGRGVLSWAGADTP